MPLNEKLHHNTCSRAHRKRCVLGRLVITWLSPIESTAVDPPCRWRVSAVSDHKKTDLSLRAYAHRHTQTHRHQDTHTINTDGGGARLVKPKGDKINADGGGTRLVNPRG